MSVWCLQYMVFYQLLLSIMFNLSFYLDGSQPSHRQVCFFLSSPKSLHTCHNYAKHAFNPSQIVNLSEVTSLPCWLWGEDSMYRY